MIDVIITNGRVVDGTGSPARQSSVGIDDGRIVSIGETGVAARRTIDAEGQVVAPGFIDVHAHYDAQALWDPTCSPSPQHGITTTIVGNCGLTLAPVKAADEEFLVGLLARVESIPIEALRAGVTFSWNTFPEFLDAMDRPYGLNIGFMVGHSALRRAVMSEAASSETASDDQIEQMERLLVEALSAGGFGFSSATAQSHVDADGRPSPPKLSSHEEFVRLAGVCADVPGTSLEFIPGSFLSGFDREDVQLMAMMSAAAGAPLNWNTIQIVPSDPELHLRQLAASTTYPTLGGCIVPLMIPHNSRNRVDFGRSNVGPRLIPGWEWLFDLSTSERVAAMSEPATIQVLKNKLAQANAGFSIVLKETMPRWMVSDGDLSGPGLAGRSLGELSAERGCEPIDVLIDLAVKSRMTVGLSRDRFGDDEWTRRIRAELVQDPGIVLGASDGGAHCDALVNVEYTSACFKELVREWQVLTVEELVHKFTDVPARLYGLHGRGQVHVGYAADLVVFDPSEIQPGPLQLVGDLPSGARRLFSEAKGIARVIVGGRDVVVQSAMTGDLPGRLLRSGADSLVPEWSSMNPKRTS